MPNTIKLGENMDLYKNYPAAEFIRFLCPNKGASVDAEMFAAQLISWGCVHKDVISQSRGSTGVFFL